MVTLDESEIMRTWCIGRGEVTGPVTSVTHGSVCVVIVRLEAQGPTHVLIAVSSPSTRFAME